MTDMAINTENLTREFNGLRAVDSLTIEVPKGIIFGFLGPNGAGKTTTIRLLLGLIDPTSGAASVLGFDTKRQAGLVREKSGALLENHGLYEKLSAEDNLEYYGRIYGMSSEERRERISELLNHIGLWERRKENIERWSKGMKQKLAIARVLLHRPPLVFLDEPTAGFDPVAAAALRDDLANLVAYEGLTVFLTTHNLAEAEKLCDRVAVINKGRLIAEGHPEELLGEQGSCTVEIHGRGFSQNVIESLNKRPEVISAGINNGIVNLRIDHASSTAPLIKLLVGLDAEVEEVRRVTASLEESFLQLMEGKN